VNSLRLPVIGSVLMIFLISVGLHFGSAQPAEVQIVCQKSFFSPGTIELKQGEPVRLVLKSVDVTHGFAVDELKIAREIPVGPPTVIVFTPEQTGQFVFYCAVRCGKHHLQMRGTIIVR